jgi:hypothetical protein
MRSMSPEQDQMLWQRTVPELPKTRNPLPFHKERQKGRRDGEVGPEILNQKESLL